MNFNIGVLGAGRGIPLKLHSSVDSSKAQTGWFVPGFLCLLLMISQRPEFYPFLSSLCFREFLATSTVVEGALFYSILSGQIELDPQISHLPSAPKCLLDTSTEEGVPWVAVNAEMKV